MKPHMGKCLWNVKDMPVPPNSRTATNLAYCNHWPWQGRVNQNLPQPLSCEFLENIRIEKRMRYMKYEYRKL
jgi:hypothetical protein